jgi:two-component system cell cycle sensor histidine kinase/response regulator CckA
MVMVRMPRILVVDDEKRLLESFRCLLTKAAYDVATATCGRDAAVLFEKGDFDLVILDVHLPDRLGTEVMAEFKTRRPETAVILITGDSDLDTALAALKRGAYDYLKKPFEFGELLHTVKNALAQKALEKEKQQIYELLRQSERKYRHLVQNSPDIIFTLDANGNFTFLNETVEQLLGVPVRALLGRHYRTIVCEEDRGEVKRFVNQSQRRDRASSVIELRLKAIGKMAQTNGECPHLTVELKCTNIHEKDTKSGDRKRVGTHGVIRDISERRRLQLQLQNAQRMDSLGTLASGVAHDFNNLLMGIQGRSSLIALDLDAVHPHLEHLHAIDRHIHSATDLTKQLLGFARGAKYQVKPTDINALILTGASMFGRTKKEIIIESRLHDGQIVVEVDRGQIEQALLNLYVNAWQAMPDGGILRLGTRPVVLDENVCRPYRLAAGHYVHVMVSDTGVGMDPKTLQQIFDPFFTTKEKGRGTGLGLASAYGIVKNHGGIISVQSEIGKGTTFNIYLPISEQPAIPRCATEGDVSPGTETVLLVDDEEMIIEVGQALLQHLGYRVLAATSGRDAVSAIQQRGDEIDLVILDIIMPGMDGGRTFDQIRKIDPQIPVMLASGYAIDDKVADILRRGGKGFIQKPFSLSEISRKIRSIIDSETVCV